MLQRDGANVKALYRAAQAHLALEDFPEAEAAIRKGLAEERSNGSLRALLKEYRQKARPPPPPLGPPPPRPPDDCVAPRVLLQARDVQGEEMARVSPLRSPVRP